MKFGLLLALGAVSALTKKPKAAAAKPDPVKDMMDMAALSAKHDKETEAKVAAYEKEQAANAAAFAEA